MKATLKRKELPQFFTTMKSLTGILNAKKAISYGRDIRQVNEKIEEIKENPKEVLNDTFNDVKNKVNTFIDENMEEDKVRISEDEIVISRTFDVEGDK